MSFEKWSDLGKRVMESSCKDLREHIEACYAEIDRQNLQLTREGKQFAEELTRLQNLLAGTAEHLNVIDNLEDEVKRLQSSLLEAEAANKNTFWHFIQQSIPWREQIQKKPLLERTGNEQRLLEAFDKVPQEALHSAIRQARLDGINSAADEIRHICCQIGCSAIEAVGIVQKTRDALSVALKEQATAIISQKFYGGMG